MKKTCKNCLHGNGGNTYCAVESLCQIHDPDFKMDRTDCGTWMEWYPGYEKDESPDLKAAHTTDQSNA